MLRAQPLLLCHGAMAGMQLYLQSISLICMGAHRPWK